MSLLRTLFGVFGTPPEPRAELPQDTPNGQFQAEPRPMPVDRNVTPPAPDELLAEWTSSQLAELRAIRRRAEFDASSLPVLIHGAQATLRRARQNFEQRAFAPFWDDIEAATNEMAEYTVLARNLRSHAREYAAKAAQLHEPQPAFVLSAERQIDPRPAAARLSALVNAAQRDFQFATIFEQRKTNKILVAGFGSLTSAIQSMKVSIVYALQDMSMSFDGSLSELLNHSNRGNEILQHGLEATSDTLDDIYAEFERNARGRGAR